MLHAKRQHPCHCSAESAGDVRRSVVNALASLCPLLLIAHGVDVHALWRVNTSPANAQSTAITVTTTTDGTATAALDC
jgi:hypothetical protein